MGANCCANRETSTGKGDGKVFLFVFPKMPGDVNPGLPVARHLVSKGNSVYYLCPDYKNAIEDTGAKFLDATKIYDLYKEGRTAETFGAAGQLKKELGFPDSDGEYTVRVKIANIELEKTLDGVISVISQIKPNVLVYDPVLCKQAAIASQISEVPAVALLAFSGHGAWARLVGDKMKNELPDLTEEERTKEFEKASLNDLNVAATKRLNEKYASQGMAPLDGAFTGGRLDPIPDVCVVTCAKADIVPQTDDMVGDSKVYYVGTLLDEAGALRCGGTPTRDAWKVVESKMDEKGEKGRRIYISMGTVTTADGPLGWQGKPASSLTGQQLAQSVWGAAFDAIGGEKGSGDVILVTVGKDSEGQPRPLGPGDKAPGNALCLPSMPQIDILTKGIDLFITHGGQNSYNESMMLQTPMLVVPTVGDQIQNAELAKKDGVGENVMRPPASEEDVEKIMARYRAEIKDKILSMLAYPTPYKNVVKEKSAGFYGGGVPEFVQVLDEAAEEEEEEEEDVDVDVQGATAAAQTARALARGSPEEEEADDDDDEDKD